MLFKSTREVDDLNPVILYGENNLRININQFGLADDIYRNDITLINKDYLDLVKSNNLQIEGVEFQFTDLKWDFSSIMQEGKNKSNYIFNFKKIHQTSDYYITVVKLYVFSKLLENGVHWSTTTSNLSTLSRFIMKIFNEMHDTLSTITLETTREFFEDAYLNYKTKVLNKSVLNSFFTYYSSITGVLIDSSIIEYLLEVDNGTIKAMNKQNKRKLLPQQFMKKFKDLLYKSITDDKNISSKNVLQSYCLIYIATQTGLRPNELLHLQKDCLFSKILNGKEITYLNYKSTKNVHGGGYTESKTIANAETTSIIKKLILLNNSESKNLVSQVSYSSLSKNLEKFIVNNASELNVISRTPMIEFQGKSVITEDGNYISIPIFTQFRVYFATELTQRGYSEYFISKLLNHKDERMFNYYSRSVTSIQEDPNFSSIIVKDTIVNNFKILGPNGSVYEKKIGEFIKERDITIKENLDQVISEVLDTMPIRRKLGGYCIKANPLRSCEHDSITDEFYCAYGLCQNQCHFFYNCTYYLNEMRNGQKLVEDNINKGFKQQAQKELYKIKSIINNRLIPEIYELQKEIKLRGKQIIIEQFSDLKAIIDELDAINEEIKIWNTKKL